ncbi:MAG: Xaa-Pro peptidase family protein [Thermosphaera sp.]
MDFTSKLSAIIEEFKIDALVLTAPDNVQYYTGIPTIADSIQILYFERKGGLRLYVPILEYYRYRDGLRDKASVYGVSKSIKPEDALVTDKDWREIIADILRETGKVGFDRSFQSPLAHIVGDLPSEKIVDVSNRIWKDRMIKNDEELRAIKKALDITSRGIHTLVSMITSGVSEAELAGYFEGRVRKEGVTQYAFDPIISFKPNNSYPHNVPTAKRLASNDIILVDVGVKYEGRCSDITRIVKHGRLNKEEKKALELVEQALYLGIEAIQPGVRAGDVASKVVEFFEKNGVKSRFIHGLGHGLGVVVHEPPYLRLGSDAILEPGMVFTIEPGLYYPGKFGVRLEEDVLVTNKGAVVLSNKTPLIFTANS